ncbi:MAG TPA: N-6 DNA methylase [Chitinophaga sp.]|uniref:HsdM family class I SAM-dependent methyltransferase n=1 Tax=Chitinophaga sp. TaxID=1869181 RepID=UPI002DB5CFFF|nr:N-6 DNA methylase [Chitinophaga sp.]HEU4555553.1 N-6 DNA methylase [Chitinophaga sp.]
MSTSVYTNILKNKKPFNRREMAFEEFVNNPDPRATLECGKVMAKAWARTLGEGQVLHAQTFIYRTIEAYWQKTHGQNLDLKPLPVFAGLFEPGKLDKSVIAVAYAMGTAAAALDVVEAGYLLGNVYTAVLPESTRSSNGVFYTPPALTSRLIQISESAGVSWTKAKVVDPACGGGAFLAPICRKIQAALKDKSSAEIVQHIQTHVVGLEIDPFGGWLTQVFVEVALKDLIRSAGMPMKNLVRICNSLELESIAEVDRFDLVIGNPPYGKLKLTNNIRDRFKESLYGHPNLYGLFTHLAFDLVKQHGIVSFLTPTSFLSGEYFKNLRAYIRRQSSPVEIDFVSFRKGVFEDVLQETMLSVYKKKASKKASVAVNQITTVPKGALHIHNVGKFTLAKDTSAPWILPRSPLQSKAVHAMEKMAFRLKDWGYKVSTGPLVWNRHKHQFCKKLSTDAYPVVWSEAVTQDGRFVLKAEKKNHTPYFRPDSDNDWLITTRPCILLQRTTAKEQHKRLIAAALPKELLLEYKGVIVENHLNMIIPTQAKPLVEPAVLAAFLNSIIVNDCFRTISGSVAVSAYELEALPLPAPEEMKALAKLIKQSRSDSKIEAACLKIYGLNK